MFDDWRSIPHLYYIQPISAEWTAMLSVNAPYGLITEWPSGWVGNGIATYSELQAIYATPSVAYRVNEKLALSGGFNIVSADAQLSSITNLGVNVEKTLTGDDLGYGYTASCHYQALDDWAVGIRYQSRVELTLKGNITLGPPANVGGSGSVDLTIPSTVNFGISNTSIKDLTIGVDCIWTEWSTYDRLAIRTGGGTTTIPKNWDNVWSIRVGGEYALGESWALRAGYVWDQSPVPDSTRAPEMPGSDRQMVMAGLGWKWKHIGIDVAYSYLWAERVDMGTIYPLPGTFETTSHFLALSASYAF